MVSGNREKLKQKLYIWDVENEDDECRCMIIVVAVTRYDAIQQALTEVNERVSCGWCIEPHIYNEDGEIDNRKVWINYVQTTEPYVHNLEGKAVFYQ